MTENRFLSAEVPAVCCARQRLNHKSNVWCNAKGAMISAEECTKCTTPVLDGVSREEAVERIFKVLRRHAVAEIATAEEILKSLLG